MGPAVYLDHLKIHLLIISRVKNLQSSFTSMLHENKIKTQAFDQCSLSSVSRIVTHLDPSVRCSGFLEGHHNILIFFYNCIRQLVGRYLMGFLQEKLKSLARDREHRDTNQEYLECC